MTDFIEITGAWMVVDRWWTDEPITRHYASLRSPDYTHDERVCVCWDEVTRKWSLIEEPDENLPPPEQPTVVIE